MSLLIDLLRGSNCTLMNKMKKNLQSNILLLPALIAGFFCYLFPILIAFWKSLFLGTGTDFVGIQNYVDLFENEAFSLAVRNLFHLWAIIIPVNLVIGIFIATVYKGNIIKNLIMDCQSYTKYRPNETTGGIFVSWRRKEELPTGA